MNNKVKDNMKNIEYSGDNKVDAMFIGSEAEQYEIESYKIDYNYMEETNEECNQIN